MHFVSCQRIDTARERNVCAGREFLQGCAHSPSVDTSRELQRIFAGINRRGTETNSVRRSGFVSESNGCHSAFFQRIERTGRWGETSRPSANFCSRCGGKEEGSGSIARSGGNWPDRNAFGKRERPDNRSGPFTQAHLRTGALTRDEINPHPVPHQSPELVTRAGSNLSAQTTA